MMKKLVLIIGLMFFSFSYCQTHFDVSQERGLNTVTVNLLDKKAPELYNATLKWIIKNYKNPEKVIIAKIENDYIKVNGYASGIYKVYDLRDVFYTIEFSFKDGKFKTEISDLKFDTGIDTLPTMEVRTDKEFFIDNQASYQKKKEDLTSFLDYFNSINKGIIDTVLGYNNDW